MAQVHPILESVRRQDFYEAHSLSCVSYFIEGYEQALAQHHIEAEHLLPADFTEWVRCRLHRYNKAKGWRLLILEAAGSEEAAFDRFFQLLEEHSKRQPLVIARLVAFERHYTFTPPGKQPIERVERYPDLSLVTYTEDPGFFALRERPTRRDRHFVRDRYYPSLASFEEEKVPREALIVLDQARFSRLLTEAEPLSPNGGPAMRPGGSGAGSGPPSVSVGERRKMRHDA